MRRVLSLLGLAIGGAVLLTAAAMPTAATIATFAGNGAGATGAGVDGVAATASAIDHPRGLAVSSSGSVLVAEPFRHSVRLVDGAGLVTRVAGTGERGFSGDGGPARDAQLDFVHGAAFMPGGGFVLADTSNHRIRRVWPDGTITSVVGTGVPGYAGDGGPAIAAEIEAPRGVAALPDGSILIPDTNNHRIRQVWSDGTITTVAGSGVRGFGGDGGPATSAQLQLPFGVSPVMGGGFLIADTGNQRIRRVSPDGRITTVAGGDGSLNIPHAVAAASDGGFLVADTGNNRIRRFFPGGTIRTVAGTGQAGYSGDGGSAVLARLSMPKAVAVLADDSRYLIADSANNRVRLVTERLAGPLTVKIPGRVRSKTGSPVVLPVVLSERASLRLTVLRGSKPVLGVRASRPQGSSRLLFGRTLAPGAYGLRLVATFRDGGRATDSGRLQVRR